MIETGVDIVEIERVARLARRYGERFARRVFSDHEWESFSARPASLAARFAAKEAVIKALGSSAVALNEIHVVRRDGERPRVVLHGRARARAESLGVRRISLSLSHSREYAVASVVLECE